MWDVICLLISHVDVAHGYFAYIYVNKISFAYPEHLHDLVHEPEGVAENGLYNFTCSQKSLAKNMMIKQQ